jgi:hypothetical protein
MHVKHDDRINAERPTPAADFMVAVDRRLAASLVRPIELGQI